MAVTAGHAGTLFEAPVPGGFLLAQQASADAPGPAAAGSNAAAPTTSQKRERMLPRFGTVQRFGHP